MWLRRIPVGVAIVFLVLLLGFNSYFAFTGWVRGGQQVPQGRPARPALQDHRA